MSYTKQNFMNGQTLNAEHLNHIEDGICQLSDDMKDGIRRLSDEMANVGNPTDEQVKTAVNTWLDDHPEATTTVLDNSLEPKKTTWLYSFYKNEYNTADADALNGYFFFTDSNANTTGGGTAEYNVSGFIPVVAGKQYCFNLIKSIKWLDGNKTFIATTNGTFAPNQVETAPENAAFVRFDTRSKDTANAYFYEYNGDFYEYSPYHSEKVIVSKDEAYDKMLYELVSGLFTNGEITAKEILTDESVSFKHISGIEEFHWNIVDPDSLLPGRITNQGVYEYRADTETIKNRVSDYIPVTPGDVYYAIGFSMYLYDSNKNFVSDYSLSNNSGVLNVPDGIAYIRCCGTNTAGVVPTLSIYRRGYGRNDLTYASKVDCSEFVPLFKSDTTRKAFGVHLGVYPWADKKFCFIGDSFTAPGIWSKVVCENHQAVHEKNVAVSGGAWTDLAGVPKTAYEQAQSLVTDNYSPDVIVCALGCNDVKDTNSIGEIVESINISDFNLTTFTGGMQACLNYLQNNFPNAVIFVGWTPAGAGCNWVSTSDVTPYIERMKEVCLMYGVKYLETRTCGITKYSASYADYFENGTNGGHPTDLGHAKIGEYMSRLIWNN